MFTCEGNNANLPNWTRHLLLVFYLFCQQMQSAGMVTVREGAGDILILPFEYSFLEDRTAILKVGDVIGMNDQFKPFISNDLKINTYYWIKYSILNRSSKETKWVLQFPLHSDELSVYVVLPNGSKEEYLLGQQLPFITRSLDLRTLAIDLPSIRNVPFDVYVRVQYKKYTDLTFIVVNGKDYLATHTKSYFFLGLIYGILFLMSVYNLILYISFKERIYIYYVLYTLSSAFFISWKDGLGFQLIWPNFPQLNAYHHSIGLFLLLITFLIYGNNFLGIRKNHPCIFLVTNGIIGLNLIYFIVTIFDSSYFDPLPLIYILSYVYLLGVTVFYLVNSYKPARYLLVSLFCMVLALLVIKLRYLGWIEWNWFVEYILNYVVVIDAIAMSLAISDKLTFLRIQKFNTEQIMLKDKILHAENELIQIKNGQLESELIHQNNQLAFLATSSIQKTEFVNQLKKELEEISKEIPANQNLRRLIKNIDKEADFDSHWENFRLNFDKANNNYLARLKVQFPVLKPADLLLCAYTKLGKSNKEIATLLNITLSGVEKKRLRLKEKMSLGSEVSLFDFLAHIK